MIYDLEKEFKNMQSFVQTKFEKLETSKNLNIANDEWMRPEGGGGITYVVSEGNFFDNCAINFSSIYGKDLPKSALAENIKTKYGYRAMGISVISHPKNPHVPTSHMNVRLFGILDKNNEIETWWIGGGYDLTPFIPYKDDIVDWHNGAKAILEPLGVGLYEEYSNNCNNYFEIPHRKERRGVGGIFFDGLSNFPSPKEATSFLKEVVLSYVESYLNIANKRKDLKFNEIQKEFQLYRRGRYVEFNLIYDRGTSFGLQSNGRVQSILASLPASAKWSYKKSKEYEVLEKDLLEYINRDWNV